MDCRKQAAGRGFAKGGDIIADQRKAQAKLVKVYQKDGKQFGVIELEHEARS